MSDRSPDSIITVLVVDDDPLQRTVTAAALERHGWRSYAAADETELWTILKRDGDAGEDGAAADSPLPVDVILMDLDLGVGHATGAQLARAVIARYNVPIVFYSAHSGSALIEEAKAVNAYGFVPKGPDNEQFIIASLQTAVRLWRAERERTELNDDLAAIFNQSDLGIAVACPSGLITRANAAFSRIVGRAAEDLRDHNLLTITAEEDRAQELDLYNRLVNKQIPSYQLTKAFLGSDGSLQPAYVSVSRVADHGKDGPIIVVARDLATTGEVSDALRRLQQDYNLLAYHSSDAITILDAAWNYVYASPSVEALLGYSVQELLGMNMRAILTAESLQEAVRAHKKRIGDSAEPIRTELEMVRKDGRRIWTENVTTLLSDRSDGQRRYLASTRDITQRRHLEDERISTEQKFRLLVEQAADLIFTLDLNGYYTYASPSYERTLGYAPRDIVGHHYRENLSDSDVERMDEMFETARDQPGRLVELELDVRTVSGDLITVHSRGGALLNRDGVVIGIAGVARDVTAERNLFREVHHRVKNNLQILNSMISLKAMELGTPALLHDLQSRVNVIGRLHETLQDRGRIDAVDLAVYLGGILDHYEELGGGHQPIEVSVESIVVTSDRAMRIGIVVNELVSNAMEHREQTSGAISVSLSREDSRMRLSVANGWHGTRVVEGRDGGAGAARRQSLGTELVGELVTQLGGTWWIEGGDDRIEAVVTLPVDAV